MADKTNLRETGTISLREALRCVVRGYGDVGQRAAKRCYSVSFQELTHDDNKALDTAARTLLGWLQEGDLVALHCSDIRYPANKIPKLDWFCYKFDDIHWHLSAIRTQPHTPMIENIELINTDLKYLISNIASEIEENDQNGSLLPVISPKSPMQRFVLQIVEELKKEGTHITKTTPMVRAIKLIQDYAEAMRRAGDMAIEVPKADTIRRALDRRKRAANLANLAR